MNEKELVQFALNSILQDSKIFSSIKGDIDTFFKTYNVPVWLSISQVSTIHEILMEGDRGKIIDRLNKYKELQLRRTSEKDRWQKEVEGKKAIDYFYKMIEGLLDRHLSTIREELEKGFRLFIDDSYNHDIYQNLIKIFDYIFVSQIKVLKDKEVSKCLKD